VPLRRNFLYGLAWRAILFLLFAFLFMQAMLTPGLGAARVLAALLCLGGLAALWRYVQRTNLELARFVDAVRFGDLSQSFAHRREGSGFDEFGEALEQGMRRLRDERHRLSDANRFYEAVLDDAPTALLTVDGEGRSSSPTRRRGACSSGTRGSGSRTSALMARPSRIRSPMPSVGRPRLVPLTLDAMPQTAMVSAAAVHRLGGTVRVVAVQPIQGELNAVEIAAQSDIVRVLTHEIMNSMTPVTSLARTAAELIAEADRGDDADIADARAAVETLARRADGVMHFVESYRQIARTPEVRRRTFAIAPWAEELHALFGASPSAEGVELEVRVDPDNLTIDADPDLMCQVLLNLVKEWCRGGGRTCGSPACRTQLRPQPRWAGADRGRRQRSGRAGSDAGRRLPAILHHQAERHGRRPQPRPAGGARPSRRDQPRSQRGGRRVVPDRALVCPRGRRGTLIALQADAADEDLAFDIGEFGHGRVLQHIAHFTHHQPPQLGRRLRFSLSMPTCRPSASVAVTVAVAPAGAEYSIMKFVKYFPCSLRPRQAGKRRHR
jgi:signal transduction histidine kinase